MLFFTKICIAVHWIEQARSIAMCAPPAIDMWAPRRISDCRSSIADCLVERQFVLRKVHRQKYRCPKGCAPVTAPAPPRLVEGGRYSVE
ncbi:MAG TPA: hypothetical protein VJR28_03170, partial [Chthoniobacterales bacterium]|nr:hypothetical protein [Chthoniobacterales bacterium]